MVWPPSGILLNLIYLNNFMHLNTFLVLLIPIFTASAAQLCFKKGILGLGSLDFSLSGLLGLIPRIFQSGWLITGIILFGISFLVYLFVLSKFQLNIAYPILVSAGIILIALASWVLFREPLSLLQILGIIFIIFGIFLLFPK